jgi:hypothetical protein
VFSFLSPEIGWVAELTSDGVGVHRTADGGRTWKQSQLPTPPSPDKIADLFFLDRNHGWLVTWHSPAGSYVFTTTDGGETWKRAASDVFEGAHRTVVSVRFLSERMGFVFFNEDPPGRNSITDETVVTLPYLAYTTDAGAHWRRSRLSFHVNGCEVFEGDVFCGASGETPGPILLRLHPK